MMDFLETETNQADFQTCQVYTRNYAKTFYFASHVLPREKRMAAYALYAFCRSTDEIVDNPESSADRALASRHLASLREQLGLVYAGSAMEDPKLRAFQATVRKYGIPQEYLNDLIRGAEMDLTKNKYRNLAELEDYCYCVASTVGLMMTKVFGVSNERAALPYAIELGKAMQLTNILRDIGEDYRRGRVYLPAEEMHRFGAKEEDFSHGIVTPEFIRLMKFQINRTRAYYKSAARGIPMLTNDGSRFCAKLMSNTYATILDAIELKGFDTLNHRASVPFLSKVGIAGRSLFEKEPRQPEIQLHTSSTIVTDVPIVQSRES